MVSTTSRVASSTSAMISTTRERRSCWRVPGSAEIVRKTGEVGRHDAGIRRPRCLQPRLAGFDAAQRRLPALLELRGDQSIIGIAGGIAPFRERGFVSRLLQLEFDDTLLFAAGFHVPPF